MPVDAATFARDGFIGPVRLFTRAQCATLARHLRHAANRPAPLEWPKGAAVTDPMLWDAASQPALRSALETLLGPDVILWGASDVARGPGNRHPWHTDIESSSPAERHVSVWIGLEDVSAESGLTLISRSHRFGQSVQEVQHGRGLRRGEASDALVASWAAGFDGRAALVQPDATEGDAIFFDGRLWHASHNRRRDGRRLALLLQYAQGHVPVFMPDLSCLEWPMRRVADRRPPVLVVSGTAAAGVNRVESPPALGAADQPAITTRALPIPRPLPGNPETGWRPHFLFSGTTPVVRLMGCHVSVLDPGRCPHPPHAHAEEEVLVPLDGEAEVVIAEGPTADAARVERLSPGAFVYYPAFQHHTIRNAGLTPITYLMLRWRQPAPIETEHPLPTGVFAFGETRAEAHDQPFHARLVVEGETSYLTKLHVHVTDLQPGAGYAPHADAHDVAIVVLSGAVESVGQVIEERGVVYCASGTLHGMKNVGDRPARYLVVEFHGPVRRR